MTDRTLTWPQDEVRPLPLEWIDERLHRYRLAQPKVEKRMAESLERYGQVSPVVICLQEEEYVLIDGFKRLTAARRLKGMTSLQSRRMDVDEQGAKAAIYNLNRIGQRPWSWKKRGSSTRWFVKTGCHKSKRPSCWGVTRAGSTVAWRCWNVLATRRGKNFGWDY